MFITELDVSLLACNVTHHAAVVDAAGIALYRYHCTNAVLIRPYLIINANE